jgi:hypothetical protein
MHNEHVDSQRGRASGSLAGIDAARHTGMKSSTLGHFYQPSSVADGSSCLRLCRMFPAHAAGGLVAGAMIWMIFAELAPDALKNSTSASTAMAIVLVFTTMMFFHFLLT